MVVTAEDLLPERRLRESYVKHAARAQLYRLWASIQEGTCVKELLEGTEAKERVLLPPDPGALPSVADIAIALEAGNSISFASAQDEVFGRFARGAAVLPRLTAFSSTKPGTTRLSAAAHRACGTVHYFIALVENPERDPKPFRELLAADFDLGYTATPMKDLAALDAWVAGPLSSVVASEHDIHSIQVRDLGADRSIAAVAMTSQALFPDGSGAISRNTQNWTLDHGTGECFPRVMEISIARDAVEFFGPAPLFEPRERP
jgi:hypothetical protein